MTRWLPAIFETVLGINLSTTYSSCCHPIHTVRKQHVLIVVALFSDTVSEDHYIPSLYYTTKLCSHFPNRYFSYKVEVWVSCLCCNNVMIVFVCSTSVCM